MGPLVALTHGYPPGWSMGGEVSLHRTLKAVAGPVVVLTRTPEPYEVDGIRVEPIGIDDVLNINADPAPIARQLETLSAGSVIAQNELSLPAVKAARMVGVPSIVSVHTPPRYGSGIKAAIPLADHAIYNTYASAVEWGEPDALIVHPPITAPPPVPKTPPTGDAYLLLSSLLNKGVEVVLELARRLPDRRFIIVRSPADPTHGLPDLEERAANLPNVELHPRVTPEQVAERYLSQARILLVPSRYETYGMSALEAAGYGIPTIHVDTPHVREGIAQAAILIPPLDVDRCVAAIHRIGDTYEQRSRLARARAEWVAARQEVELADWAQWVRNIGTLSEAELAARRRRLLKAQALARRPR